MPEEVAMTTQISLSCNSTYRLRYWNYVIGSLLVALVLTLQQYLPFTVLKPCILFSTHRMDAFKRCNSTYRLRYWNRQCLPYHGRHYIMLQQYLPFTVLKLSSSFARSKGAIWLQQYLPFTVLKLKYALRRYFKMICCNSTYRLRYWNFRLLLLHVIRRLQQYLPFTVLKRACSNRYDYRFC